MRFRSILATAAATAAVALPATPVMADERPVLVDDDDQVTLTYGADREATASVTVSNPRRSILWMSAQPAGATSCRPTSDPVRVPGHTQRAVTFTFRSCDPEMKDGVELDVIRTTQAGVPLPFRTVDGNGSAPASIEGARLFPRLTANPSPEKTTTEPPSWIILSWFWRAGAIGLAILAVTYFVWVSTARRVAESDGATVTSTGPLAPLPNLGSSWSFKESWATNATVITAAFTGIFGATDVATTIFGEATSKEVVAILGVAAAGALALVGTAPLLLQATRTLGRKADPTPLGIIAAGTITVAGTGGALGIVIETVHDTDVGDDALIVVAGCLGAVVLGLYTALATLQNLYAGMDVKAAEGSKPAPVAFELLLQRITQLATYATEKQAWDRLPDEGKATHPEPTLPAMPELVIDTDPGAVSGLPPSRAWRMLVAPRQPTGIL